MIGSSEGEVLINFVVHVLTQILIAKFEGLNNNKISNDKQDCMSSSPTEDFFKHFKSTFFKHSKEHFKSAELNANKE